MKIREDDMAAQQGKKLGFRSKDFFEEKRR